MSIERKIRESFTFPCPYTSLITDRGNIHEQYNGSELFILVDNNTKIPHFETHMKSFQAVYSAWRKSLTFLHCLNVFDMGNGKQKSEICISALKFCAQGGNPNLFINTYR